MIVNPKFFSQQGEDILLAGWIGEKADVFWIDVGAWHPENDSVTKYFYDRGGHGINIEPVPEMFAPFPEARPRDVNLCCACGDKGGKQVLTVMHETGLSTMDEENAARLVPGAPAKVERIMVDVFTLANICQRYVADKHIDFLKIDCEKFERQVLLGADFHNFRPDYLCIESTLPGTMIPSYAEWEPIVFEAGYEFIIERGVNRYYHRMR